jgi:peptidyl-prolyl cis-trans isomerase SurA
VVGERAIVFSELQRRAAPHLSRLEATQSAGAKRNAVESAMYKRLVEQMIDEELEYRAAIDAKIVVANSEVEGYLRRTAARSNTTVEHLETDTKSAGELRQFREEIRRAIVRDKLVRLLHQPRIHITEHELKSFHLKLMAEERQNLRVRAAWIYFADCDGNRDRRKLADVVARSAASEDFGLLSARYSDERSGRQILGELDGSRISELPPEVQQAVTNLKPGQVSGVISVSGGCAVVKLLESEDPKLRSYEEERDTVRQRLLAEKLQLAHREWLRDRRRQHRVEVRL